MVTAAVDGEVEAMPAGGRGVAGRLHVVPFGAPARALVTAVVGEVKAADPLAPVTVVVPSALAGLSLRRSLALAPRGSVGVRVRSLPQVASELGGPVLAAAGRRPLTSLRRGALVRAALAGDGDGGGLGAVPGGATEAALAATFADLAGADDRSLAALAARSARAGLVVAAFRRYRRLAAPWYDDADVTAAAAGAVRSGTALRAEVGHVVLHVPRRLSRAEVDLVAALAAGGVTAVVGRTGAADADEATGRLVAQLAPVLGPAVAVAPTGSPAAPTPPVGHRVVRAPDPEEEVRVAVRELVAWLASDPSHRADRVAFATRLGSPYDLLLADALAAAGVAHHTPTTRTLAQSVAGRTLLGLLALPDRRLARSEVMRWLRSAPVVEADGRPVPAARWDRLSRRAGVAAGAEQWAARLGHLAADLDRQVDDALAAGAAEERWVERVQGDRAEIDRLAAFVADLAEQADPGDRRGWADLAGWAGTLLRRYLGPPGRRTEWPPEEQAAADRVVGVLGELAGLADVEEGADPALLRRVLERALAVPVPGAFGRGALVGRVADLVGVEVDRLVVLGMDDGRFPPKGGDDPLLPDRERRAAGVDLPLRAPTRGEEHRDLLAALAGARFATLSCARTDPRAQRRSLPAPWLLDTASALAGRRVRSADLRPLASAGEPWLLDVPSFAWWLGDGRAPASVHEWELAALLAAHRPGEGVAGAAAVDAVPGLARGVAATVARRRGEFSVWTGLVGPRPELCVTDSRPRSPTSLERWATCPFQYFLATVLRVTGLDDPAEADTVGPLDRGALVHDVLEAVVRPRVGAMAPGEPWGPADHARLLAVAEEARQHLEDVGRTGRPLLWRLEWSRLVRDLAVTLQLDSRHRAAAGTAPVAVEHGFGFGDEPPVEVGLGGDRTVTFRGRIDRVDAAPGGAVVEVVDYKTGGARGYEALKAGDDITAGGRLLQLGVYARAARATWGGGPVDASYWFVTEKGRFQRLGGRVDAGADRRLEQVVTVVADGIEAGNFPARPGDDDGWFGPVHCRGCPYDRICPSARGEQWERIREHDALTPFVELVEGP
jgi:ATP-dependent helicase/nuclease subunit B